MTVFGLEMPALYIIWATVTGAVNTEILKPSDYTVYKVPAEPSLFRVVW